MALPNSHHYRIDNGVYVLVIEKSPKFNDEVFRENCFKLLKTGLPRLRIDLSGIKGIASPEIEALMKLKQQAQILGIDIKIRATSALQAMFRAMEVDYLLDEVG
jgi:hypothetical protein